MKRHTKSHVESANKESSCACEQCEYKANRKDKLKTHVVYDQVEVLYACEQCESKANRKDKLNTHAVSAHA